VETAVGRAKFEAGWFFKTHSMYMGWRSGLCSGDGGSAAVCECVIWGRQAVKINTRTR